MALCFRILARPGTVLPNETGGEVDAFDPGAVLGCYSRSKALATQAVLDAVRRQGLYRHGGQVRWQLPAARR